MRMPSGGVNSPYLRSSPRASLDFTTAFSDLRGPLQRRSCFWAILFVDSVCLHPWPQGLLCQSAYCYTRLVSNARPRTRASTTLRCARVSSAPLQIIKYYLWAIRAVGALPLSYSFLPKSSVSSVLCHFSAASLRRASSTYYLTRLRRRQILTPIGPVYSAIRRSASESGVPRLDASRLCSTCTVCENSMVYIVSHNDTLHPIHH